MYPLIPPRKGQIFKRKIGQPNVTYIRRHGLFPDYFGFLSRYRFCCCAVYVPAKHCHILFFVRGHSLFACFSSRPPGVGRPPCVQQRHRFLSVTAPRLLSVVGDISWRFCFELSANTELTVSNKRTAVVIFRDRRCCRCLFLNHYHLDVCCHFAPGTEVEY